jgi:hypothetical protein
MAESTLPPRVEAEVRRILNSAARRLLAEGYRPDKEGNLVKPKEGAPHG